MFAVLKTVCSLFKSRRQLTLENLALRQQLAMLKPSVKRPQVSPADCLFWILFSKYVDGWRTMLHALHPDTGAGHDSCKISHFGPRVSIQNS
jgi:hypothetical protein